MKKTAELDIHRCKITRYDGEAHQFGNETYWVKTLPNLTKALEEFSDLCEDYDRLDITYKDGSISPEHDVFWIRDHYIHPHITEDITKVWKFTLYQLTEEEQNPITMDELSKLHRQLITLDRTKDHIMAPGHSYQLLILNALESYWDDDEDIQNIIIACSGIIERCAKELKRDKTPEKPKETKYQRFIKYHDLDGLTEKERKTLMFYRDTQSQNIKEAIEIDYPHLFKIDEPKD